jgi:hypothetical protein
VPSLKVVQMALCKYPINMILIVMSSEAKKMGDPHEVWGPEAKRRHLEMKRKIPRYRSE